MRHKENIIYNLIIIKYIILKGYYLFNNRPDTMYSTPPNVIG
jgi:hypothetical protein